MTDDHAADRPDDELDGSGAGARPARGAAGQPQATDLRIKTAGLQVLMRMAAAVRIGRSYQVDNQVFVQQLDVMMATIGPLLEEANEMVLVALDSDLYLNGVRIPVKGANYKFHQSMIEDLRRRQIAGFRMQRGVTNDELIVFFRLFLQPDVYQGTDLLKACLAQGADRILPVIHASTEAPEDGFEYDLGAESPGPPATDEYFPSANTTVNIGGEHAGGTPGAPAASERTAAPRGAARKNYSAALKGAKSLLTTTSLQGGMELRHAKRVVQPLVDGAFAEEPVVVGLSTLTHRDEYTYAHSVNVCLVAVSMGKFLDLDRRALADLGVAALLHDVGKAAVADQIKHPFDEFTSEDAEAAARHPLEGVKLMAASTTLNQTTLRCMRVALEHHMSPDGSGYPALPTSWAVSGLSRLVTVADCYVSLLGHRSERGAFVTPFQALGMMLGPLRKKFDPAMLWALVQTVGFYPPGQLILLEDGSVAVVLAPNAQDLARPHVRILFDMTGLRLPDGELREFKPLPPEKGVKRALIGDEYPPDDAERWEPPDAAAA